MWGSPLVVDALRPNALEALARELVEVHAPLAAPWRDAGCPFPARAPASAEGESECGGGVGRLDARFGDESVPDAGAPSIHSKLNHGQNPTEDGVMESSENVWMVRAGRGCVNVEDFIKRGLVAFGDPELGELCPRVPKDDLLALYAKTYPEQKEGSRAVWASQVVRFLREIRVDDTVVTFDRDRRLYYMGTFTSGYEWAPEEVHEYPHVRRVHWTDEVPRDGLSVSTRNTLGAILTLFRIGEDAAKDLLEHKRPIGSAPEQLAVLPLPELATVKQEAAVVRAGMIQQAEEFIEDSISGLDWSEMQDLVAGILRAMGYRTTVSPPGSDRAVDVFASPDGLGLQEPRIFVEVKHRKDSVNSEMIRAFLGGRKQGDKCLYVSTGSFTKDARYEADRASVPIRLLNLHDLRELVVDNYESLDAATRQLVPLQRLYWPLE